ncbi:MAG: ComF family protein [Pseudomonadota bacterium]
MSLATQVLDFIYPHQCVGCGELVQSEHALCGPCWRETPFIDGAICDHCGAPLMGGSPDERDCCDDCLKTPRPWTQGRSALIYVRGARRFVLALKHGGREDNAVTGAGWMAQAGREILSDETLLVPIPLHWIRRVRRRYNQAALLTRELGFKTGCPVMLDALIRPAQTKRLDRLSPKERFKVLEGAIRPNPKRDISGRHVVLIDDVMTSGATLAVATQAALHGGAARVDVLTLARAVKDA